MPTTEKVQSRINIHDLAKMAICLTALIVASYIRINLGGSIPAFTAQTIAVNLIALLLPPKQALATIGTFLVSGLIGLPVFGPNSAGPATLFGPYGGYYFGFVIAVFLISLLKGQKNNPVRFGIATIVIGIPVIELSGMFFMMFINKITIETAFTTAVVPFLLTDTIKCILSSVIAGSIYKATKQTSKSC